MFKQMFSGFTSFFTSEKVLILVVFLVLILVLSMYSGSKIASLDTMTDYQNNDSFNSFSNTNSNALQPTYLPPQQSDYEQQDLSYLLAQQPQQPQQQQYEVPIYQPTYEPQQEVESPDVNDPSDLLPADQNSKWASLNPVNSGNIAMPDLLQAGYHIGLDTIGQTLRNANLQLRSDPIIPKTNVGPWMQSTIEPDFGRVPLEIGSAVR